MKKDWEKKKKKKKTNKASFLFLHTLNLQVPQVTHTHTSPCHYKYILAGMVRRNKSLKLNVFGCLGSFLQCILHPMILRLDVIGWSVILKVVIDVDVARI